MKVETDAVLVVFWMWEERVLRWRRPVDSLGWLLSLCLCYGLVLVNVVV